MCSPHFDRPCVAHELQVAAAAWHRCGMQTVGAGAGSGWVEQGNSNQARSVRMAPLDNDAVTPQDRRSPLNAVRQPSGRGWPRSHFAVSLCGVGVDLAEKLRGGAFPTLRRRAANEARQHDCNNVGFECCLNGLLGAVLVRFENLAVVKAEIRFRSRGPFKGADKAWFFRYGY